MRVLHINDQAGVACVLAKYQLRNGIESKVVSNNTIDKFGILKFYKDYVNIVKPIDFVDHCIAEAKDADIIHIHSNETLVFKIREAFGNSKKIILHYHGTDIRGLVKKKSEKSILQNMKNKNKLFLRKIKKRLWLIKRGYYKSFSVEAQNLANEILVATPDLLTLLHNANYLPNPVDLDHFSKKNNNKEEPKYNINALTIHTETGDIQKTLEYCKINNINLKINVYDRTKKPLLYEEVPNFLKKYDIYVDIRVVNGKILENYSKTALESLACGLKVLNYKLEYVDKLPEIHNPVNVVNKLQNIYNR